MIGYHANNNGIANSLGEIVNKPSYLEWLLANHPDDQHKIFYDIDAAVASILRLAELTQEEYQKLFETKRTQLKGSPYHLFYFPGKVFGVDKGYGVGHSYVNFVNACQYQDVHYTEDITMDCAIRKAEEAEKIGNEVLEAYRKLNLPTDKLVSPVSALEKGILKRLNPPTIDDVPEEVGRLAYGASKANWLEAYQMGSWEKAYDYDINGAYAFELSKLLDIRRGEWVEAIEKPVGAVYGFVEGDITTYANFHPFLLNTEADMTYTPVGTWRTFLTMQELEFLYEYKLGKFKTQAGYWWIPKGQQYEPFKGLMRWLYNKRKDAKGIEREILHRCMAGVWGLFLQFKGGEFGDMFNPVYGSIVEANTRLKVAGACLDAGVLPLHLAVDGIITNSSLPVKLSDEMGGWRLSHIGGCIIAGCGAVAFEGKGGPEEFSLHYDWLHREIEASPRAKQYKMLKFAPVKLGEAILKGKLEHLGEIENTTRTVFIGEDGKRIWKDTPKNGGQLLSGYYESASWEVGIVLGMGRVEEANSNISPSTG